MIKKAGKCDRIKRMFEQNFNSNSFFFYKNQNLFDYSLVKMLCEVEVACKLNAFKLYYFFFYLLRKCKNSYLVWQAISHIPTPSLLWLSSWRLLVLCGRVKWWEELGIKVSRGQRMNYYCWLIKLTHPTSTSGRFISQWVAVPVGGIGTISR